ncbi:hypothetical protein DH2020_047863 [Rehmannia glutinosa]|uniref:F-box protein At3g26010-like beta-propeller domain-containing protein n=1 Tax=Rehmannia glutinosa TaxID=99300 RepID=A0ABR0U7J1_REHGL
MELKDVVEENVLPFLPAKSLLRFRSVSKQWDVWIRSPFFARQQSYSFQNLSGFFCQGFDTNPSFLTLNHSAYGVPTPSLRFLPDRVDIKSSSCGLLVCQGRTENNSYYICNPANETWKKLPEPNYYHGLESALVLAFEPSLLNLEPHYSLVCAVHLTGLATVCFELYSSETRTWKCSAEMCAELGDCSFTGNGFYMKGMAYWETSRRKILAFDMKNDVYGIISLPSDCPPRGMLAEIREELCYIGISNYLAWGYTIKIYTGADLAVRQQIDLRLEPVVTKYVKGYRVLPSLRGDAVIILAGGCIYSYSLKDERVELMSGGGVEILSTTLFFPYVNSLISVA